MKLAKSVDLHKRNVQSCACAGLQRKCENWNFSFLHFCNFVAFEKQKITVENDNRTCPIFFCATQPMCFSLITLELLQQWKTQQHGTPESNSNFPTWKVKCCLQSFNFLQKLTVKLKWSNFWTPHWLAQWLCISQAHWHQGTWQWWLATRDCPNRRSNIHPLQWPKNGNARRAFFKDTFARREPSVLS